MVFALAIVGLVLLVTAVRGTTSDLFMLVRSDFIGTDNFIYWLVAILIIGAVGFIPKARPISTALLGLVVVVLFLKNGNTGAPGGGFFSQFTAGLQSTTTAAPASAPAATAGTAVAPPVPFGTSVVTAINNFGLNTLGLSKLPSLGTPGATGTFPPTVH
jgi:hypothetical protein